MDQYVVKMNKINPAIIENVSPPAQRGIDWVRGFLVAVQLIIFFAVLVACFWLFLDDNPAMTINSVMLRGSPIVEAGGAVIVDMDSCKYTNSGGTVSLTWVDDLVFNQAPDYRNAPQGCHATSVLIDVPANLPPSEYEIIGHVNYQVNPLAVREVIFRVGPLTVIPHPLPD